MHDELSDTEGLMPLSSFLQKRVIDPVIQLLRVGATPRQLAWSMAVGAVIGINPLLGSTTLLALAAAALFRLNVVASQLAVHSVYPLELLLFPVFIRLGIWLFHTPPLPLEGKGLFEAVRHHLLETTRMLWRWEWHALLLWAAVAVLLTPVLAFALYVPLERLACRAQDKREGKQRDIDSGEASPQTSK